MFFDPLDLTPCAAAVAAAKSRKVAKRVATLQLPESLPEQSVSAKSLRVAEVAGGAGANLRFANSQRDSQNSQRDSQTCACFSLNQYSHLQRDSQNSQDSQGGGGEIFESATRHWLWQVTSQGGDCSEVSVSPMATAAEMLVRFPDCTVAPITAPAAGIAVDADVTTAAIRWLDAIGETDQATRAWFLANLTAERIALFAPASVVCEISPPFYSLNGGEGGAYGLGLATGVATPAACCDRCAIFHRNPLNPTGGLGHCDHLDKGRMTLPPRALRDCAQYRPIGSP